MNDRVRAATIDDYTALNAILEQDAEFHARMAPDWMTDTTGISEVDYRACLANPDEDILVLERDDVVVGLIQLRIGTGGDPGMRYRPYGWIDEIAVAEKMRDKGAGTRLMRAAEAWAGERGLRMLMLDVWVRNERAIGLYEKMGYTPLRKRMFRAIGGEQAGEEVDE